MKRLITIVIALLFVPIFLSAQNDTVFFSRSGGFYDAVFDLTLSCGENHHIRYTVNGATPSAASTLYQGPLTLDEGMFSQSNIHTIVNCIPSTYHAVDDVKRVVVIRAAAFDENDSCVSRVMTNTYIINDLGGETHGLPVVSIATDSLSLFDYDTGIFVPGVNYDPSDSTHTGNYYQRGREWERLINVEFYETNNFGVNQQCGLRMHGGASRWFQQKGMRLYAREEYGKKRFKHQFFFSTPIDRFKHLNLHPFRCSNWLQTGGQDYLAQCVARGLDFESLAVREVVVYINGEYWGIYTLEESPDERYLEDHFGVDLEQLNMFKYWGETYYGDGTEWWLFRNWLATADLTDPADYEYAASKIDVNSFIDYMLYGLFSANLDWPINNVMLWQATTNDPVRFIFYDGDGCYTRWYYRAINNALDPDVGSIFFAKFFENDEFRERFCERYEEMKSTTFGYESMKHYLDEYRHVVQDEIVDQADRFWFPRNYERWERDMDSADYFLQHRHEAFEAELYGYVSVEEVTAMDFKCWPNPSSGAFEIEFESFAETISPIEIFDATGRRVYGENYCFKVGNNHFHFNSKLPQGLYVLKIGNRMKRIVIQ